MSASIRENAVNTSRGGWSGRENPPSAAPEIFGPFERAAERRREALEREYVELIWGLMLREATVPGGGGSVNGIRATEEESERLVAVMRELGISREQVANDLGGVHRAWLGFEGRMRLESSAARYRAEEEVQRELAALRADFTVVEKRFRGQEESLQRELRNGNEARSVALGARGWRTQAEFPNMWWTASRVLGELVGAAYRAFVAEQREERPAEAERAGMTQAESDAVLAAAARPTLV